MGRSRGQGETVSHRPVESGELSGSLYTLSFSCEAGCISVQLQGRVTGETDGTGEKEGENRKATLTAGAQRPSRPVCVCVCARAARGTAPAMDVELRALRVVHAKNDGESTLKERKKKHTHTHKTAPISARLPSV